MSETYRRIAPIAVRNNENFHYAAFGAEELSQGDEDDPILIGGENAVNPDEAVRVAVVTMELAGLLGIVVSPASAAGEHHALVSSAPRLKRLLREDLYFLRGWPHFQSCVKGFNALGLMAEQVIRLEKLWVLKSREQQMEGLCSYLVSHASAPFEKAAVAAALEDRRLTLAFLAWQAFADRTIVCSTSTNMGVALHEAILLMRQSELAVGSLRFRLLNDDEGRLIIWAPDRRADFMSHEKADYLESLEKSLPETTRVRSYINRKERDPGAMLDAIQLGGYFFPTNPQSKVELKALIYNAFKGLPGFSGFASLEPDSWKFMESLGVSWDADAGKLIVMRGVEGGLYGLMVPYLLLVESLVTNRHPRHLVVEAWNQASIGAALAAAVLAAKILQSIDALDAITIGRLEAFIPGTLKYLRQGYTLDQDVHGVFDLANIQSLAQLLGVVVEKHKSGKSTPFVGLGSSSYSNGNLCYDILRHSMESDRIFAGTASFHPATHTINYVAQALIYGEASCLLAMQCQDRTPEDAELATLIKPEPAGATALAGYLLRRLDDGTLSVFEIALELQEMGFDFASFIEFCNMDIQSGWAELVDLAVEEGAYMGQLMRDLLILLQWPPLTLKKYADRNRRAGRTGRDGITPASVVAIYLTGDNTRQPALPLKRKIIQAALARS